MAFPSGIHRVLTRYQQQLVVLLVLSMTLLAAGCSKEEDGSKATSPDPADSPEVAFRAMYQALADADVDDLWDVLTPDAQLQWADMKKAVMKMSDPVFEEKFGFPKREVAELETKAFLERMFTSKELVERRKAASVPEVVNITVRGDTAEIGYREHPGEHCIVGAEVHEGRWKIAGPGKCRQGPAPERSH